MSNIIQRHPLVSINSVVDCHLVVVSDVIICFCQLGKGKVKTKNIFYKSHIYHSQDVHQANHILIFLSCTHMNWEKRLDSGSNSAIILMKIFVTILGNFACKIFRPICVHCFIKQALKILVSDSFINESLERSAK